MTAGPSYPLGVGRALGLYLVTLLTFFAIDLVWLGVVAKRFYREHLGHLLGTEVNWGPALLFYLIYIAGIVVFAIRPALDAGSPVRALAQGAFFGFVAYATYDLTNHATLRDWPLIVTVVDLAWGSALTAAVAYASYQIWTRLV